MHIGIDIGGSHIGIGCFNHQKKITNKVIKEISPDLSIHQIVTLIVEELQIIPNIESIGIGVPGVVSNGIWKKANYLNIHDFPLVEELSKYFEVPIYLENDSNCAGVGQLIKDNLQDAIFITIGSGIGGAIIKGGQVWSNNNDCIAEFGHLTYMNNGLMCSCKRLGCYSQYASMKALRRNISQKKGIEIRNNQEVITLLEEKDQEAMQEFRRQLTILKQLIGNIANLFGPKKIILGGGFSYLKPYIPVEFYTDRQHWYYKNSICQIEVTTIGNDAGLLGAAFQNQYIRKD